MAALQVKAADSTRAQEELFLTLDGTCTPQSTPLFGKQITMKPALFDRAYFGKVQ